MAMVAARRLAGRALAAGRRRYADVTWSTEPTRPVGSSLPLASTRVVTVVALDEHGSRHEVKAMAGESVYRALVYAGLRPQIAHQTDILFSCSGNVCRVSISEDWMAKLNPPEEFEKYVLSKHLTPPDEDDSIRCSCQIPLSKDIEGMTVALLPAKCWDLN